MTISVPKPRRLSAPASRRYRTTGSKLGDGHVPTAGQFACRCQLVTEVHRVEGRVDLVAVDPLGLKFSAAAPAARG